ncbi:MAG: hypothetical protein Q7T92_13910 [Lutibacter sp.]|nr:hypothetical protein [Lutibacter sp.]
MNIIKIFRAVLIALVIGGLSYPAFLFVNSSGGQYATKVLIIFGTLGLIFFVASIRLISTLKDKS